MTAVAPPTNKALVLPALALNPALSGAEFAGAYARNGRVRIPSFLHDDAALALHRHLRSREDWLQVINSGDRVFELDRQTRAALTVEQRDALGEAVQQGAREGFQYRYETLRLGDGDQPLADEPLHAVTRFMSSKTVRDFLRRVTGIADITFADGQATAYAPEDLLTGHDDDVVGKHRRAAYVLGLTPVWRTEWGGLLLFHATDRAPIEGYAPGYNTLDLFAVPQMHSVSMVTAAAAYRRYAITGWLRRRTLR